MAIQLHLAQLQALQQQWKQVISAMTACLATLPEAPYLLSVEDGFCGPLLGGGG